MMKKIILLASIALGLGLASCVKEQVNSSNGQAGTPITITASTASDDGTRTAIGSDGITVTWAAGDQIKVWDSSSSALTGAGVAASPAFNISTGAGTTAASFTGTLPLGNGVVGTVAGDRVLYATYPVGAVTSALTATSCTFDLPADQTQTGAEIDAGKYLYMWADPVDISGVAPSAVAGGINFNFHYLCTIVDIPITGVPAGETVTKVAIHGDNGTYKTGANTQPFMTRMQIHRAAGLAFDNVGTPSYFVNDVSVSLTGATVATGITAHIALVPRDSQLQTVGGIAALPTTGAETTRNLTITISTDKNNYVFNKLGTDTHFEPGTRYKLQYNGGDFNLTAQGATILPTPNGTDATLSGTTIQVLTGAGLKWVADNNTAFSGYKDYSITVMNPITLTTSPWTPIGTSAMPFVGTFDGGNQAISGLVLATATAQGLFGYAGKNGVEAEINNVAITASTSIVAGTGAASGALLGCGYNVSIDGCSVTGAGKNSTVVFNNVAANSGVLVGELNNSSITNCVVSGVTALQGTANNGQSLMIGATSNANSNNGGGGADGPVTISGCTVKDSYYSTPASNQTMNVGGILGVADNIPVTIDGCQLVNTGISVTGAPNNGVNGWGGIVGLISASAAGSLVTNCSTDASSILNVSILAVGGICGSIQSASAITNCTNNATVAITNGQNIWNRAGGICGAIGSVNPNGPYASPVTAVIVASVPALIMGCVNYGNVTGGGANQAEAHVGGICGVNGGGMIAGCKQAAGTITGKSGTATAGSVAMGGICGLNTGVVSGCCVTGGTFTAAVNSGTPAQHLFINIIANNQAIDNNGPITPITLPGTIENSYYVASAAATFTAPNNPGATFDLTGATDFASATGPISGAGWDTAPTNYSTYAPAASLWATWASPWSSLGSAPSTYPKLTVEP